MTKRNNGGFSLIELSVVLVVVGLVAAGGISIGSVLVNKARYESSHDKMQEIAKSLKHFYTINGRLPCPAPLDAVSGDSDFGREIIWDGAGASCANDTTAPSGTTRVETVASSGIWMRIGAVPTEGLALSDTMMEDEFGNRITYAVAEKLTDDKTFMTMAEAITVNDGAGADILTDGAFVLISHGEDDLGATNYKTGVEIKACGSTGLDIENCDDDTTFTDTIFNREAGNSKFFDDIVVFSGQLPLAECGFDTEFKMLADDAVSYDGLGISVSLSGDTAAVSAYRRDDDGSQSGAVYVFVCVGKNWVQQARLNASDAADGDRFGYDVAIDDDTMIVGAYLDDDAGSAYIFTRLNGVWSEKAKLTASDAAAGDSFGYDVDLDGDTALVAATGDDVGGAAYVFIRSGSVWSQQAKLTASDEDAGDAFGRSVALDGDSAIVGASGDDVGGAAYVFTRSGSVWSQQAKLTASDEGAGDDLGYSVALSDDTALIGAYGDDTAGLINSGSAYVFTRSGTSWREQVKLTASDADAADSFGRLVALGSDVALVGAYSDDVGGNTNVGSSYVFTRFGSSWTEQRKINASDADDSDVFGWGLALDDNVAIIGASGNDDVVTNSGSAYAYRVVSPKPCVFSSEMKRIASDGSADDEFGASVAVDRNIAVIGAKYDSSVYTKAGAAYVFVCVGNNWVQHAKLTASDAAADDNFGYAVSVSGSTVVVGAHNDDDPIVGVGTGSAYVFTSTGTSWTQTGKLTASDLAVNDNFGYSVSVDDDTVLVGAYRDDVGGGNTGSAYVFTRSGTVWSQQAKLNASVPAAQDNFGYAVSVNKDSALIGARGDDDASAGADAGSAYIFTRSGAVWTQQAKLTASDIDANDRFGDAVSLNNDTALVGSYWDDDSFSNSGSAYVFTRSGAVWSEQQKLVSGDAAENDNFGRAVSVYDDIAIVGSRNYDDAVAGSNAGSAYIYTRSGTSWTQADKITASDAAADDKLGFSVAISGSTAIVSAPVDDDNGSNSGSAYMYKVP